MKNLTGGVRKFLTNCADGTNANRNFYAFQLNTVADVEANKWYMPQESFNATEYSNADRSIDTTEVSFLHDKRKKTQLGSFADMQTIIISDNVNSEFVERMLYEESQGDENYHALCDGNFNVREFVIKGDGSIFVKQWNCATLTTFNDFGRAMGSAEVVEEMTFAFNEEPQRFKMLIDPEEVDGASEPAASLTEIIAATNIEVALTGVTDTSGLRYSDNVQVLLIGQNGFDVTIELFEDTVATGGDVTFTLPIVEGYTYAYAISYERYEGAFKSAYFATNKTADDVVVP